jgi:hypothetical protein
MALFRTTRPSSAPKAVDTARRIRHTPRVSSRLLPRAAAGVALAVGLGLTAQAPASALSTCSGHGGILYAGSKGPVVHNICFDGHEAWI